MTTLLSVYNGNWTYRCVPPLTDVKITYSRHASSKLRYTIHVSMIIQYNVE